MSTTEKSVNRIFGPPLVAVCLGFAMITMDATVVTTATPSIGHDLGSSVTGLQWVLDGYTLTLACLLLSAGSLGDRLGARTVYLAGVTVFAAASAACALAPDVAVLNVARVLQGLGASCMLPTSLSLLSNTFPGEALRARALGVWGALGGSAAGAGPVLGGVLTTALGWRSIFLINLPLCALAIALTVRFVPRPTAHRGVGFDPAGQALAVVTAASTVYTFIELGAAGWSSLCTVAAVVALVSVIGFFLVEKNHPNPMLPIPVLRLPNFSPALGIGLLINLGLYGELFLLSLYFHDYRHFSPMLSGVAIAPMAAVTALGSWWAGRWMAKAGTTRVMLTGLLIGVVSFAGLSVTVGGGYLADLVAMIGIGVGMSFTMPAATTAAIGATPPHRHGLASGAFSAGRQLGSALGVAVFGLLLGQAPDFLTGIRFGTWCGAAAFAIGALLAWRIRRPTIT
jgi:DHA2 family methylenomycin A resistance protein-like MFS transporter